MKANVKLVCRLIEPEDKWENITPIEATDVKAIAAFCIQRMAKILGEGGILEMHKLDVPELEMSLIPLRRVVDMRVTAEVESEPAIDTSTDVQSAIEAKRRANEVNASVMSLLMFPTTGKAN